MIFAPLAVVLPICRGQIQVKRKICLKIIGPVQVKKPVRFGSCITPVWLLDTYIFFPFFLIASANATAASNILSPEQNPSHSSTLYQIDDLISPNTSNGKRYPTVCVTIYIHFIVVMGFLKSDFFGVMDNNGFLTN